jgi:flavin-dependent dehydrogenase
MRDDISWVVALRPVAEWRTYRADPDREYARQLAGFPVLSKSLAHARQRSRLSGTADLDGFFRPAVGPGWVLVGDAGHTKDPGRGRGISDALVQAHLVAGAISDVLCGRARWDGALLEWARTRDEVFGDLYDLTHDLADAATLDEQMALMPRVQEADDRQLVWLIEHLHHPTSDHSIGDRSVARAKEQLV